ncbi:GNAT family N-acetyltransferase [Psychrobacillus sp. FSL H8-0484]|uniref:GNAT family N-acetyltransferase n=1 Tax=Psychrobacillus sp. FSL H8-0484 TaxID=2921390 RepID=UPI0030F871DE
METFKVRRIDTLVTKDLFHLIKESKKEGFRFLERLMIDYEDGTNTFHRAGECLFGVYTKQGVLIAIGGLNLDPFSDDQKVGRLRRFYVAKEFRRRAVGTLLLNEIITEARKYFNVLVLHTDTVQAAAFYHHFGFLDVNNYPNSTHYLNLQS